MKSNNPKNIPSLTLEEQLSAIGIMISTRSLTPKEIESVDIEEALANALIALDNDQNQRLLGLLLSWISTHGSSVIIEKLMKILIRRKTAGNKVHFAALIAQFADTTGFKRWHILSKFAPKQPILIGPSELAQSLVNLRGEEKWSKNSGFVLPKGTATIDSKWALSREALAGINSQYRNRLIYGAQWRADIITSIEKGAKTPTEISRMCGASYEPCHRVMSELKDAGLLKNVKKTIRRAI